MARSGSGRPGVYLDWNATAPLRPEVIQAMVAAAELAWANPASTHALGRRARVEVEELREALGAALAVHPRDVVLTSGGTEANNLRLARAPGLVTSRLEHPSIVRVAESLEAEGKPVRWISVPNSGRVEPDAVAELCGGMPAGSWVAVQAANHETGVLQPIGAIAPRVHSAGLLLHVDAVQAFGKVDLSELQGADSIAVASHKIRGPKGIGALAFRRAVPPPLLVGGSQERGLRPGTVDPVAAAGFRTAVMLLAPQRWAELAQSRDAFEGRLERVSDRNGEGARLPHVLNRSFRGWKGDELVAALDLLGVCVSSGSACAAGTAEASPVITAMLGRERALSAVRISFGDATTDAELESARRAFETALGVNLE
ncbi:MAG TPA: cysteine desulfurase family protein [Polyangiaceae bacterium]|nr:cysteine desulfurase family protein [Polyangiaceae bacterium]